MKKKRKETHPKDFLKLKAPCVDCPFRKDRNFPMRKKRRENIVASLKVGQTFPCHKEWTGQPHDPRCFGAASTLHKSGFPPVQMEQVATRLGLAPYPAKEWLLTPLTFNSLRDFIAAAYDFWEKD